MGFGGVPERRELIVPLSELRHFTCKLTLLVDKL